MSIPCGCRNTGGHDGPASALLDDEDAIGLDVLSVEEQRTGDEGISLFGRVYPRHWDPIYGHVHISSSPSASTRQVPVMSPPPRSGHQSFSHHIPMNLTSPDPEQESLLSDHDNEHDRNTHQTPPSSRWRAAHPYWYAADRRAILSDNNLTSFLKAPSRHRRSLHGRTFFHLAGRSVQHHDLPCLYSAE